MRLASASARSVYDAPTIWTRLALICTTVAGLFVAGAGSALAAPAPVESQAFVPGEVIVRFAPGSAPDDRQASLAAVHPSGSENVEGVPGTRVLDLPGGESVDSAVETLEDREDVAWAEPNYVLHTRQLPNDPRVGLQWGIRNVGQNTQVAGYGEPVFGVPGIDIDVARAWDRTTVGGGPIAIVDTGIDPTHPDIADNIDRALSRNFIAEPSLEPDPPVDPEDWADVEGHGTHVAGIIGAIGDNGLGVTGVDWKADLVAVRVCGPDGECTSADTAAGLAYAGEAGIPIANASLGTDEGTAGELRVLREAIADHPGTLYVVAAGNGGPPLGHGYDVDEHPEYPCSFDLANIVCVAALAPDGSLASFSNWGSRSVDIAAPGVDVESTIAHRIQPFAETFADGIGGWTQAPYPWEEGEVEGDPTLAFHGLDGGVPTPVPEASATLGTGIDLAERLEKGRACSADLELALELHGDQTLTVEAAADGGTASPLPPTVYRAGSLPADKPAEVSASLARFDGEEDVKLSFVYRANGTLTPLPSVEVAGITVHCVTDSSPVGDYQAASGTSAASPFVAGVAALGRSIDPTVTVARLREAVLSSALPTPAVAGKTVSGGRVDAARLLDELAPPSPPAPTPTAPDPEPPSPAPAATAGRDPAKLTALRVSPHRLRLAAGRGHWVRARVRNLGDRPVRGARICLRAPRAFVQGSRCAGPRRIAAHSVAQAFFRVRLRRGAPGGRTYRLRLAVHAPHLRQRRGVIRLGGDAVIHRQVRAHRHLGTRDRPRRGAV